MVRAWFEVVNSFRRENCSERKSTAVVGGVHELNSVDVRLVAYSVCSRDRVLSSGINRQCARLLGVKRPTV
jgi:hypothetical protein